MKPPGLHTLIRLTADILPVLLAFYWVVRGQWSVGLLEESWAESFSQILARLGILYNNIFFFPDTVKWDG